MIPETVCHWLYEAVMAPLRQEWTCQHRCSVCRAERCVIRAGHPVQRWSVRGQTSVEFGHYCMEHAFELFNWRVDRMLAARGMTFDDFDDGLDGL